MANRAVLKNLQYVNVLDFGALGDGVTDDSASIYAAVAQANQLVGQAVVFFPPGDYRTADGLVFNNENDLILQGSSRKLSRIGLLNANTATSVVAFRNCFDVEMEQLQIDGECDQPLEGNMGVDIRSGSRFHIHHCRFTETGDKSVVVGSTSRFAGDTVGATASSPGKVWVEDNEFTEIYGHAAVGTHFGIARDLHISRNHLQSGGNFAFDIWSGSQNNITAASNRVKIADNTIESLTFENGFVDEVRGIRIKGSAENVSITDNLMWSLINGPTSSCDAIRLDVSDTAAIITNVTIDGNTIRDINNGSNRASAYTLTAENGTGEISFVSINGGSVTGSDTALTFRHKDHSNLGDPEDQVSSARHISFTGGTYEVAEGGIISGNAARNSGNGTLSAPVRNFSLTGATFVGSANSGSFRGVRAFLDKEVIAGNVFDGVNQAGNTICIEFLDDTTTPRTYIEEYRMANNNRIVGCQIDVWSGNGIRHDLQLGRGYVWADQTGDVRFKTGGDPINDLTDGTVVGTQT